MITVPVKFDKVDSFNSKVGLDPIDHKVLASSQSARHPHRSTSSTWFFSILSGKKLD